MQPEEKNPVTALNDAVLLHMVCGKIASGKSTLAATLANAGRTVRISEDVWLSRLYPGQILTIEDYVRRAKCLKDVLADHTSSLLRAGVSVVLDFPFNTVAARAWGCAVAQSAGCAHRLHFLDVSDTLCKERLRVRNALAEHPFRASEAEFEQITRYFVRPDSTENLNVVIYNEAGPADDRCQGVEPPA
ncbi:Cell division protein ZipA [Paraburkholderia unamae]|uniref:AAA family ATPase n=1 Tax=Paraburkholderia unamae TaxID=219649 RepID=UPI000DC48A5D|nr:ATP-binding protein [Paraburkholderia unamae]RAR57248.1 putative kinase [Paraburkholderia unamae]CAG9243503.1 Cell division protein ZipA [Paraburkholderia unamae]